MQIFLISSGGVTKLPAALGTFQMSCCPSHSLSWLKNRNAGTAHPSTPRGGAQKPGDAALGTGLCQHQVENTRQDRHGNCTGRGSALSSLDFQLSGLLMLQAGCCSCAHTKSAICSFPTSLLSIYSKLLFLASALVFYTLYRNTVTQPIRKFCSKNPYCVFQFPRAEISWV